MHSAFRRTLAALLFLFALAIPATAATYYVSPSGSDSNPGTQAAPFLTIQQGLNNAGNGGTVIVADGTYTGPGNVDLDFGGYNIALKSVSGASKTIIDCQDTSDVSHRGFYFHRGETAASVSGFTIQNGYVEDDNGGGVDVESGSTVAFTSCTISGNQASDGGGIYNGNDNFSNGSVSITNCTISGNTATYGGGIYNDNENANGSDGNISIANCIISGNTATYGGGIYNINYNFDGSNGIISVTNCTISGNSAINYGGGVENDNSNGDNGSIIVANCTISGNSAYDGGGILNLNYNEASGDSSSSVSIASCTVNGNTAAYGGGIYNFNSDHGSSSSSSVTDCTVTGNSAYDGGGILNANNSSGSINIASCTVTGNAASTSGGGIRNVNSSGSTSVTDCIVYGDNGAEVVDVNANTVVTYNDVKGGYSGSGNINANPLFVRSPKLSATPPDYGDLHLKAGSPCLGAGIAISGVTTDLDGRPRRNPPTIGAYEYVNTAPPVTVASLTLSPTSVKGGAATSTGTITLSGPAPSGGLAVKQTSSDTSAATLAPILNIPAGATSAKFKITTYTTTATKTVSITSSANGGSQTASLTVTGAAPVIVSSLSLSPTSVVGGSATSTGTITFSGPVPAGGLVVTLTSSDTSTAPIPATLNILAGVTSAYFYITTNAVTSTKTVTITSSVNGSSKTATLTVTGTAPPAVTVQSLTLSPTSVKGGAATSTGTITLSGPVPAGGLAVTQTSSDTSAATLAPILNIPAGATSAKFKITTYAVTSTKTVTISSSANGSSQTAMLTVTP